jgi:hypothetical protein
MNLKLDLKDAPLFGWLARLQEERQVSALEHEGDLEARRERCQAKLAEARAQRLLSELGARIQLAKSWLELAELKADAEARRTVAAFPPHEAQQLLRAQIETERLLLELEALRRQRRAGIAPAVPPPTAVPVLTAATQPVITPHVSESQSQKLAQRAVVRFANLPPEEAERQWAVWRTEIVNRLPRVAAEEVLNRASQLRALGE